MNKVWVTAIVTSIIAILSVIVFFAIPNSKDFMSFSMQLFIKGEIWRLFTFPFTHVTAAHLTENMVALALSAVLASELDMSGYKFLSCFLIASLFVAIAESPFYPGILIAGASVGIASLLGYQSVMSKKYMSPLLIAPLLMSPIILKYVYDTMKNGFGKVTTAELIFHLTGFIVGVSLYFALKHISLFKRKKNILQVDYNETN